ncbi:PREDICTED: uncharacterized protein LOC108783157 [Cyphomyrmex costatus]|uniref:uncharacterized protein LOC108783157 n=1 Tax=Cyphomyrmex costatus TaxID=456900 RepID=UPI0008523B83|nr:PREDICTED: uncharacterized protein LOC108783157 [Cyphomyrmex costatus]
MVAYCFVEGCTSSKYKKKSEKHKCVVPMYGFPNNIKIKEKWMNALLVLNKQSTKPSKHSKICLKHFSKEQTEKNGLQTVRLRKNAVPNIFPNAESEDREISKNADNFDPDNEKELNPKKEIEKCQINELTNQDFNNSSKCNKACKINLNELQKNIEETPASHHCSEEVGFSSNMQIMECIVSQATKIEKIRYVGDLTDAIIENMSRDKLIKVVKMLKEVTRKKDIIIKRLRNQLSYSKNKLNTLGILLTDLKQKYSLPSNFCKTLQGNLKALCGQQLLAQMKEDFVAYLLP